MAKVKPKPPQSKTVTLKNGTRITGPVAVIEKIQRRDGGAPVKRAPRKPGSAESDSN